MTIYYTFFNSGHKTQQIIQFHLKTVCLSEFEWIKGKYYDNKIISLNKRRHVKTISKEKDTHNELLSSNNKPRGFSFSSNDIDNPKEFDWWW